MTKRSLEKPVTRIQVDLAPMARERLTQLREQTEAASYSEVVKRAVHLYELVHTRQEQGHRFGYVDNDGHFYEVHVLT